VDKENRIIEIKARLEKLPKGTLTYKNINGKNHPYLQYTKNGKSVSRYIKLNEIGKILFEIEERNRLSKELDILEAYVDNVTEILAKHPTYNGVLAIGLSDFYDLMERHALYVDKTDFITEWWLRGNHISLITRPRRFGKTLLLNTVYHFFSIQKADENNYFKNLAVWNSYEMRSHKGKYPVIFISFAAVKPANMDDAKLDFAYILYTIFKEHNYLAQSGILSLADKEEYAKYVNGLMNEDYHLLEKSINVLCRLIYKHTGQKSIILLDEYDTPMIEAYCYGFWDDMSLLYKSFFNLTFKSNEYCQRALISGITRITKESLFSDLNNLSIFSVLSEKYSKCCGFTEEEVFDILNVKDVKEHETVKKLYDGYTFGKTKDIYNPWSILSYISTRNPEPFWVNTGGTRMLSTFIEKGGKDLYYNLEPLLYGETIHTIIDESIAFQDIDENEEMVYSLLLAAGYIKADNCVWQDDDLICDLSITNVEAKTAFKRVIKRWIGNKERKLNEFSEALLSKNIEKMHIRINDILLSVVSYYDIADNDNKELPERFYHGLILGLIVELKEKYIIKSNRESGFGRYDVCLIPRDKKNDAFILEFKIVKNASEESLNTAFSEAIMQIENKKYSQKLVNEGIREKNIMKYVLVFCKKEVFIREISP